MPSELNSLLASGEIDVAPSSSIEYALHADTYSIFPDLVIGARGKVHSIILISRCPPQELNGSVVAMPNASATSVVLLKILLKKRWRVEARFQWFDQLDEDPFQAGASAALFIGDVALRRELYPQHPHRFDLGQEWWEETGKPFAFAVWQANGGNPARLRDLHRLLLASRDYGQQHRSLLAPRYADHFRMEAVELERYWGTLVYDLDRQMLEGLQTFYEMAREIGELERVPELRLVST